MLTAEDLRWNFQTFDLFSRIGVYPFEFVSETGNVRFSRRKQVIWLLVYCPLLLSFAAILSIRLAEALLVPGRVLVFQIPPHMMWCTWLVCVYCWIVLSCFIISPVPFAALLTELLRKNEGVPGDVNQWSSRKTLSKQEWYVKLHPIIQLYLSTCYLLEYCLDPTRLFYFHSLVPRQSAWTTLAFGFIDGGINFVAVAYFMLADFTIVSFFLHVNDVLKGQTDLLNGSKVVKPSLVLKATWICRKQQLLIQLFNGNFSCVVFGYKLACLTCAISGFYYAITVYHTERNLLVSLMCYGYAGLNIMIFVFVFDRAFEIPLVTNELKQSIQVQSRLQRHAGDPYLRRAVRSIPNLGIKVGGFKIFERESTPIFADFIAGNVVNLLIAFNYGRA